MLIDSYPYLVFAGQAEEAYHFYAKVLEAEEVGLARFKDMEMTGGEGVVPEEAEDRVMNATLQLPNGSLLMFSDTFPGMPYKKGDNVTVTLVYYNLDETKSVFDKLAEGGTVNMELQETFWSPLYGILTDKFGVKWQLSTSDDELPEIEEI